MEMVLDIISSFSSLVGRAGYSVYIYPLFWNFFLPILFRPTFPLPSFFRSLTLTLMFSKIACKLPSAHVLPI